jgi:inosose dehydratase
MSNGQRKVGAAPISWGVCEADDWGLQLGAEQVLSEAASLGFDRIEVGPPGFLPVNTVAARELLSSHGLAALSGFVGEPLHHDVSTALQHVSVLQELGAEHVVLAPTLGGGDYDGTAALNADQWASMIVGIERIASEVALEVVVHPHVGTAIASDDEVRRLLEHSRAQVCLDTGHMTIGGVDIAAFATEHASRVGLVHLKDVDAALTHQVRSGALTYSDAVRRGLYRPLGDGDADIPGVIAALDAAGYDGWYVLEQDIMLDAQPDVNGGPATDVARSRDWLLRVGQVAV